MKKYLALSILTLLVCSNTEAQFWKKKKDETPTTDSTPPKKEEKKSGGSFFQKIISKVAKGAANVSGTMLGTTKNTDNFESFLPAIFVSSNLYPKSVGTMQTDFFNGWKEGGDLVGVMLLPKDKSFFYKLDGDVMMNGVKSDYQAAGTYTKIFDGSNSNKTLELKTKIGSAKFTLVPKQNKLKIVSVNGQTSNATIDLSKDFTLELDGFTPNSFIKLEVVMQTIGIRAQIEVGSFRAAKKITIPGYMFKHLNQQEDQNNFKFTNPYIFVSETEVKQATDENGIYKEPINYYAGTSSYMAVNILNPVQRVEGFKLKESNWSISKQNAYFSSPLQFAKTIAPVSITIKGNTYYYDQSENKVLDRTITTTKEIQFPQIPTEVLNSATQQLYTSLASIFKEEMNVTLTPPDEVVSNKIYQDLEAYQNNNENVEEHFSASYKNLKEFRGSAPLAFSLHGETKLIQALNTNAILKAVVNISLSWENKVPIVSTTLNVELLGMPSGGVTGASLPSKFFTANIKGINTPLPKGTMVTTQLINNILQINNLSTQFKQSLKALLEKEKTLTEYTELWKLQQ
jgi:hypothetical protein